jgi:hypothetical protein
MASFYNVAPGLAANAGEHRNRIPPNERFAPTALIPGPLAFNAARGNVVI